MVDDELRLEIVLHRKQSARTCLREAVYLREGQFYNASMTRFYYACYHVASALLIASGIEVKTHSGVRLMLGREFVQAGKLSPELGRFYTNLFNKRQDGDYDDFILFEDRDIEEVQPLAEIFVRSVERLIDETLSAK